MNRLPAWSLALAALLAMEVALPPSHAMEAASIRMAQAGSTGGTIGRQNKSVSGGEEAPPARSKPAAALPAPALSAGSISGSWKIDAKCKDNSFTWPLVLQGNGSGFAGTWNNAAKVSNGRVEGQRVSFVTKFLISRSWTATLSSAGGGLRMQGRFTGPTPGALGGAGNCTFTATKG